MDAEDSVKPGRKSHSSYNPYFAKKAIPKNNSDTVIFVPNQQQYTATTEGEEGLDEFLISDFIPDHSLESPVLVGFLLYRYIYI